MRLPLLAEPIPRVAARLRESALECKDCAMDFSRITTLTLDCYGTLIDWEAGAVLALRPILNEHGVALSDDEIVRLFQAFDGELAEMPYRPYREVLADVIEGFAERFGFQLAPGDRDVLAASVPSWPVFPDTVTALQALSERFRVAIISNIDDDLFAATLPRLGTAFDEVVTAEQARCYKPDVAIYELAIRRLGVPPEQIAHVAAGASEIPPARCLGCATVWVRRRGRSEWQITQSADLVVPDLASLVEAIPSESRHAE